MDVDKWPESKLWWKWHLALGNNTFVTGGSSYSTKGYALDAAMGSALMKSDPIIKIEISPAKI